MKLEYWSGNHVPPYNEEDILRIQLSNFTFKVIERNSDILHVLKIYFIDINCFKKDDFGAE